MSYVQETQSPAPNVALFSRWSIRLSTRTALPILLALAFLHGSLYALFLPPWGLIDEAQHLHYIQYIAEERALPVAGDLYLSDQIVQSLFATHRWEIFQWPAPPGSQPEVMGLEGRSYEAYQPPLFYLLMTPFYWALPDEILVKVYALRMVVVLLSLVTVWALYRTAVRLLPQSPYFPFLAGLLLVAIPERAIATSRINNDVLLEVLCALFCWVLTNALLGGLTLRRSLLLGVLLGLAVWVKTSAALLIVPLLLLLWVRRRQPHLVSYALWTVVAGAPFALLLVLRNWSLYQDLTGFAAFEKMQGLAPADTSFSGIANALLSVPNHFWLVWWKGSEVGGNLLLTLFYWLMAGVVVLAGVRVAVTLWRARRQGTYDALSATLLVYGVTVLVYALAVLDSYFGQMVPVIQGRFMLPAMLPAVLLMANGLHGYRRGDLLLVSVIVALWVMGIVSLFGNLTPYYYYWSGVRQGIISQSSALTEQISLSYQRLLLDKAPFVVPLLLPLLVCYGLALVLTLVVTLQSLRDSSHQVAVEDPIAVPAGNL